MREAIVVCGVFLAALLGIITAASCSSAQQGRDVSLPAQTSAAQVDAEATFPSGSQGELIRYGHDIITQTPRYAAPYVTAQLSCAACHAAAGRQPHAGSFLGSYARFPQWNKRAHRYIALQDRIAECFLYSMNGRPPPYESREMIAITAYIAWLSRGAPVGIGFADQAPVALQPRLKPGIIAGSQIYAARCIMCHGASGGGVAQKYPPLWGPLSFNDKAGMSRLDRMAPFVKVAMPQNAPGSLSDQEAVDVSAFVLSKPRPHFHRDRTVRFPPRNAGYF
ncbi:MAG: c-type cytochrome [Candidatus Eremiobacteraeota bacterium]|nr:c-type cytochrome [Candidatus Eremiobacteraeota bacterium]